MSVVLETLKKHVPEVEFQADKNLAQLTYFKIGGTAEVFCTVTDRIMLRELIETCIQNSIPYTILGGASNVVVSAAGIDGLVIKNELSLLQEPRPGVVVAESGIKMATLVSQTVALGYTGLEYFLGIPGTLGGATYNNGHYLSHLIGDYITRVLIINEQGAEQWLAHAECEFGYDSSRFHHTKEVIVAVEFSLKKGTKELSQSLIKEATLYRAQTQPLGIPSSGCIFQNTPNTDHLRELFPQFRDKEYIPSGFLIDQAGLKGHTVGGVRVSEKHAAWIINNGTGTSADVKKLIQHIKYTVKEAFGADLQEEVFYLGNDERLDASI